ncbi:bifunctional aminoglycoside phosphotransferase/ATP-binding protein [Rhizobium sp. R693]|uniref:bifunctional aminoglycoside phosphotransferase/ATP-binding protein n=1 Tax=Rhizobium sp. R693 TaxID=1764276 RepID=UPI000B52A6DE|nr:bifunctional aminoglycoside phosphotransferase/ATP-binding protein [Rhizobium sp. R693]OWV99846.1 aminoglycoside phosphotransferase [Rhizobium sp. R693]
MLVQDQSAIVAFLKEALRRDELPVEVISTHISIIFLSGDRAYKMKRAVKLPYVDFSSIEARLAACHKEVEFNGVTAPETYLGVRLITEEAAGHYNIDGSGPLREALVEMRRFDQSALLDNVARSGGLTRQMINSLAYAIARYHRGAKPDDTVSGRRAVSSVLEINEAGFATSNVFSREEVLGLTSSFYQSLAGLADLLEQRGQQGKIRRCHGDLHLRNIFLLNGEPRLFDCIEFNDRIATSDVLYDLAFLLMDLWHRREFGLANSLMNRYLDEMDDEEGFEALPFFLALRAAVRAHVLATNATDVQPQQRDHLIKEARSYFRLAGSMLRAKPPRLLAIGGLSGSGKTTLAEALAPLVGAPPGARIIESDRLRKAMHGVPSETKLPAAAYRPEISAKVYREMAWRARLHVKAGGCVIVDGVFDKPRNRKSIEESCNGDERFFQGVWLDADPALLRRRVVDRLKGVSDAGIEVLERQLDHELGVIAWQRFDAGKPISILIDEILHPCDATKENFDVSI